MKCKLFFSLLFISISISAQNNIEINLSKKQLREIKKIEKFKLMGLNNYGIDVNANDWVSALRYYLIGKTVSNNNGIPILVPVSTFGNKYLIQGKMLADLLLETMKIQMLISENLCGLLMVFQLEMLPLKEFNPYQETL